MMLPRASTVWGIARIKPSSGTRLSLGSAQGGIEEPEKLLQIPSALTSST